MANTNNMPKNELSHSFSGVVGDGRLKTLLEINKKK